jgi:hypothetical protein
MRRYRPVPEYQNTRYNFNRPVVCACMCSGQIFLRVLFCNHTYLLEGCDQADHAGSKVQDTWQYKQDSVLCVPAGPSCTGGWRDSAFREMPLVAIDWYRQLHPGAVVSHFCLLASAKRQDSNQRC